jgi:hypothetical protein
MVKTCFQLILEREPTSNESMQAFEMFDAANQPVFISELCRALLNSNEFNYID